MRGDGENEFNSNDMKSTMKSFKRLLIKKFIRYTWRVARGETEVIITIFHFIQFDFWQQQIVSFLTDYFKTILIQSQFQIEHAN